MTSVFFRAGAAACGGAIALGLAAQPAAAEGGWTFVFAPQLRAPSLEGTAELGAAGGPLSFDAGDILDTFQAGGLLHFEGRHHSNAGFMLDLSFTDFDQEADSAAGAVDADIEQLVLDAVISYRFGGARNSLDVYAGLRHWDVDAAVPASGGAPAAARSASWTDPIAGLRWQKRLTPKFRMTLQGDIGGFGAGSEETWSVTGGVIYDRWERASIYMTYQARGVEYREGIRGTASFFEYDTVTHALMAGVGLRF